MKNKYFLLIIICFLISQTACKKSDDNPENNIKIKIEGFQFFDALGNPLGRIGPADNDWQLIDWANLSAFEQSLLSSQDNVTTANTSVSTVFFSPFPNPVATISRIALGSDDSVKFKLVMVDELGTVLKQFSSKIKGPSVVEFDMSARYIFPDKKSLRYYYSFSAENYLNFKVGYGDIKVCDGSSQMVIEDCFN